ncbi:gramicidin dehydrogenase [Pelomyxa schiedti]|nr:gramicidin dehydrogenase [Pelomyxa schiedti]
MVMSASSTCCSPSSASPPLKVPQRAVVVGVVGPVMRLPLEVDSVDRTTKLLTSKGEGLWKVKQVSASTVASLGGLLGYDCIVVCGGMAPQYAKSMQFDKGRDKIREFVERGGGFIGICAGAYLASKLFWGLVDCTCVDQDHWERGSGDVEVLLTTQGCSLLLGEGGSKGMSLQMNYMNGPLFASSSSKCDILGNFTSEVSRTVAPKMIGTGAIVSESIGAGRVVLFGTHPEKSSGPAQETLAGALKWVLQRKLSTGDPEHLPSSCGTQVTIQDDSVQMNDPKRRRTGNEDRSQKLVISTDQLTIATDTAAVTSTMPNTPVTIPKTPAGLPITTRSPGTLYPGNVEPRPPWVGSFDGPPKYDPQVYLFCFHGGGGNYTDFKKWDAWFDSNIRVCSIELPGHFSRYTEQLRTDFDQLVKEIATVIIHYIDRPYAIFGQSMGALLGFEVSRQMKRIQPELVEPLALFLSGRKAAHLKDPKRPEKRLSIIDDPMKFALALSAKYEDHSLKKLVAEKPEAVSTLIAVVKADNVAYERFQYVQDETTPFNCPIHAFVGGQDKTLTVANMAAWQEHTTQPLIGPTVFDGPHNYLLDDNISHNIVNTIQTEILEQYDRCGFNPGVF